MTATQKLCRNCKWCDFHPNFGGNGSYCLNPEVSLNPISGESRELCFLARGSGVCGKEGKKFELMNITLEDLWKELHRNKIYFPSYTLVQNCISITAAYEFEPYGRASETWEIIWRLTLPCVAYYWKSTAGWKKGEGKGMEFKGRTSQEVIDKAFQFMKECDFEIFTRD